MSSRHAYAPFVHLRAHSAYSLAEGAITVGNLVRLAVEYRLPALALADTGNLFGSLEFSKACADAGVQPIIGCLLGLHAPLSARQNFSLDALPLYAKNQTGYKNLLKLVSRSFVDAKPGLPPHITLEDLEQYSEGLIALTGGTEGTLGKWLYQGQYKAAEALLDKFSELFPDRLYVELTRFGLEAEQKIEEPLLELADKRNLPLVATNDAYFAKPEMYEAQDALLCIAEGKYVLEDDRRKLTREHYFKSPREMGRLFADIPEALENTLVVAERCAVMSEYRAPILPRFPTHDGRDEAEELRAQAEEGLRERLERHVFTPEQSETEREAVATPYRERLAFELNVIIQMQFPGYFLIVSDFIKWTKRQGIPVGPGRGSGAGSLVAWALEITDLNPIRFGLLFERFLNPERVSMPDFDIDFCQDRRDEVIHYVQQKYGQNQVAHIITFGKLQARAVLRDVGRVLQMPYGQVDKICKLVPNNPASPVTLEEAIKLDRELQSMRDADADVAKLLSIGLRLEGLYRHASTHAAGVVIGDRALDELVPLYRDPRSAMLVVQYSMKYAEAAGLVKFDFLGLKTLTVIAQTCKLIRDSGFGVRDSEEKSSHPELRTPNPESRFDITTIPLDDAKTYAMLSEGDAVGIFQFESAGMRDSLKKLKPDAIEDLIALGALYRPGPMDNIPSYIACKHGLEKPDYLHPLLEDILKETFGVIIYQEQVMQIAQVLAGYSLGQADLLRRAMGKKIKSEMDEQRATFLEGAVAKGIDKARADFIFDLVAKFAGYGFNKSHAAAYALISYQTAYLKANYPVEFFVASMNLEINDTDKLNIFYQEAIAHDITVLPPDVNSSSAYFTVEGNAIRYGLAGLKGVGAAAMESLVPEREQNGAFADIFDFVARLDNKTINKRQLESLIKAGAFDALHPNRRQLFDAVEMLTRYNSSAMREKNSTQISLFGDSAPVDMPKPALPAVADWPLVERLQYEFEAVGFFLSAHPLDGSRRALERLGVTPSLQLPTRLQHGSAKLKLAGVVTAKKIRRSARGKYAFIQLSDTEGVFEVSIFDDELLTRSNDWLENGNALFIRADGRTDENGTRIIAEDIIPLEEVLAQQHMQVMVTVDKAAGLPKLKSLLTEKGKSSLYLKLLLPEGKEVKLRLPQGYALTQNSLMEMRAVEGVVEVEEVG